MGDICPSRFLPLFVNCPRNSKDQQDNDNLAALQAAIALDIERGPAGELDIDAIKRKTWQLARLDAP
jgi:hypothetical protein